MGLGSGIRKKPIPDPGSGGQKGTGSRIPDPQHCVDPFGFNVDSDPGSGSRKPSECVCMRIRILFRLCRHKKVNSYMKNILYVR
jgi:hypothetical protein